MKNTLVVLILLALGNIATAATTELYCDDLNRLDNLPHLNSDQFKQFVSDHKKVDRIVVSKERKQLYILQDNVVLNSYTVALGQDPYGPKHFEGDSKTPEGLYSIDSKNSNSNYHKALHISYPNKADLAYAKAQGRSAGGDIMVHGFPNDPRQRQWINTIHPGMNWTTGCVAVTDPEIDEIFGLVDEGTKIEICKLSDSTN